MKFVSFSVGKVIGSQSNIIEDRLVKSYYGDLTRSLFSYLTAVLSSFSVSSTDKYMRDVLPEPGLLVHRLTLRVVDDGQGDLLQDGWQRPVCNDGFVKMILKLILLFTFIKSAPASHPGFLADEISVILRDTDWNDVRLETDWLVEPEKY